MPDAQAYTRIQGRSAEYMPTITTLLLHFTDNNEDKDDARHETSGASFTKNLNLSPPGKFSQSFNQIKSDPVH